MPKTIKVSLTIDIDGDNLKTNISMDNVATLSDVISMSTALNTAHNITKNQLAKFIETNGDVHKDDWEGIGANTVLLCGVSDQITEES